MTHRFFVHTYSKERERVMAKGKTPFQRKLSAATSLKFYKDSLKQAVNKAFADIKAKLDTADIRSYIKPDDIQTKLATIKQNTINIIDQPTDVQGMRLMQVNIENLISNINQSIDKYNTDLDANTLFQRQFQFTPDDINNMRDLSNNQIADLNNNINNALSDFNNTTSSIDATIRPSDVLNNITDFNSRNNTNVTSLINTRNADALQNTTLINNVSNLTSGLNMTNFNRMLSDSDTGLATTNLNNIESTTIGNSNNLAEVNSRSLLNQTNTVGATNASGYDTSQSKASAYASTKGAWKNAYTNMRSVTPPITDLPSLLQFQRAEAKASLQSKGVTGRTSSNASLKGSVNSVKSSLNDLAGSHTSLHQLESGGALSQAQSNMFGQKMNDWNNSRSSQRINTNNNIDGIRQTSLDRGSLTDGDLSTMDSSVFTIGKFTRDGEAQTNVNNSQQPIGNNLRQSLYTRANNTTLNTGWDALKTRLALIRQVSPRSTPVTRNVRRPVALTEVDTRNRLGEQTAQTGRVKQSAKTLDGDSIIHDTIHKNTSEGAFNTSLVNTFVKSDPTSSRFQQSQTINTDINTLDGGIRDITPIDILDVVWNNAHSGDAMNRGNVLADATRNSASIRDLVQPTTSHAFDTGTALANNLSVKWQTASNTIHPTSPNAWKNPSNPKTATQRANALSLDTSRQFQTGLDSNVRNTLTGLNQISTSHMSVKNQIDTSNLNNMLIQRLINQPNLNNLKSQSIATDISRANTDVSTKSSLGNKNNIELETSSSFLSRAAGSDLQNKQSLMYNNSTTTTLNSIQNTLIGEKQGSATSSSSISNLNNSARNQFLQDTSTVDLESMHSIPATRSVQRNLASGQRELSSHQSTLATETSQIKANSTGFDTAATTHASLHKVNTLAGLEGAFVKQFVKYLPTDVRHASATRLNGEIKDAGDDFLSRASQTSNNIGPYDTWTTRSSSNTFDTLDTLPNAGSKAFTDVGSANASSIHSFDKSNASSALQTITLQTKGNTIHLSSVATSKWGVAPSRSKPLTSSNITSKLEGERLQGQRNVETNLTGKQTSLENIASSHQTTKALEGSSNLEQKLITKLTGIPNTKTVDGQNMQTSLSTTRTELDSRPSSAFDDITWTTNNASITSKQSKEAGFTQSTLTSAHSSKTANSTTSSRNENATGRSNMESQRQQGKRQFTIDAGRYTTPTDVITPTRNVSSQIKANQIALRNKLAEDLATSKQVKSSSSSLNADSNVHSQVHALSSSSKLDQSLHNASSFIDLHGFETGNLKSGIDKASSEFDTSSKLESSLDIDGGVGNMRNTDASSQVAKATSMGEAGVARAAGDGVSAKGSYASGKAQGEMSILTFDKQTGLWKATAPGNVKGTPEVGKATRNTRLETLLERQRKLVSAQSKALIEQSRTQLSSISSTHTSAHRLNSASKLDVEFSNRMSTLADMKAVEASKTSGEITKVGNDLSGRPRPLDEGTAGTVGDSGAYIRNAWDAYGKSETAIGKSESIRESGTSLHQFDTGKSLSEMGTTNLTGKSKMLEAGPGVKADWGFERVDAQRVKTLTDLEDLASGKRLEATRSKAEELKSKQSTLDTISTSHLETHKLQSEGKLSEMEGKLHPSTPHVEGTIARDASLNKLEDGFANRTSETARSDDVLNGNARSNLNDAETKALRENKMSESDMKNKNADAGGKYDTHSKDANAEGKRLDGKREVFDKEGRSSRENTRDGLDKNGEARNKWNEAERNSRLDRESESKRKQDANREAESKRKADEEARRKADEDRRLREEEAKQKLNERLNTFVKLLGGVCIFTGSCGGTDLTGGSGSGSGGTGSGTGGTGSGTGGTGGGSGGTGETDAKKGATESDDTTRRNRIIAIVLLVAILLFLVM